MRLTLISSTSDKNLESLFDHQLSAVRVMTDSFSKLPAELLLAIVLELPDLRTLYSAVLSSPDVYAVFCSNPQLVFITIVQCSIPSVARGPMVAYMHLLRECYRDESSMRKCTWQQLEAVTSASSDVESLSGNMPRPVIWHTIAQFVRNHDLAYYILRAKLDYLGALRFEKLADPHYRYRREERLPRHIPPGEIMEICTPLQDPSWIEENRVVLVLWLLTAGWRISNMCIDIPEAVLSGGPIRIQKELFGATLCPAWKDDLVAEIALSVSQGPTLKAPCTPSSTPDAQDDGFRALQAYPIPHPPHVSTKNNVSGLTTSPCYSRPVAQALEPTDETWMWHRHPDRLTKIDTNALYIKAMRRRPGPGSALEGTSPHQLERLGFGIWDKWRVSCELHIRTSPELAQRPRQMIVGEPGVVSRCDSSFRWFKLHEQEVLREFEGWHR